jgi:hypothetical protein
MRCSKCGTEGIPGKKFCAECGSPLLNRCSNCGSDNAPAAKFCADCGIALGDGIGARAAKSSTTPASGVLIGPEQPAAEAIEGERKTVTALFADIKGSMELMEDLDPEEARAIVDPALKLMIDAVHRYDGYIFAAVSPSPQRPSVRSGKLRNGHRAVCNSSKYGSKTRRNSAGRPARMRPAYIRSRPLKYPTRIESSISPFGR